MRMPLTGINPYARSRRPCRARRPVLPPGVQLDGRVPVCSGKPFFFFISLGLEFSDTKSVRALNRSPPRNCVSLLLSVPVCSGTPLELGIFESVTARFWSWLYALYTTHYTLHTTHYTLHSTPYALHHTPHSWKTCASSGRQAGWTCPSLLRYTLLLLYFPRPRVE